MNGFKQYNEVLSVSYLPPEFEVAHTSDIVKKEDDILDLIFTVDPLTGYPTGDISMYMSDKTSAEVREFISQNLMRKIDDDGSILDLPSDVREKFRELPDDLITELSRDRFESVESYEERISEFLKKERNDFIRKRSNNDKLEFFDRFFNKKS